MREKLDRAIVMMEKVDILEEQVYRASELRERLFGRELVISVIGQFKRGKSSLINALLGDELLPVGIIPLTTAVTEIRQGDGFRGEVYFADGSKREIGRSELPDYISEQKNPNNQRNVTVVKLWTKCTPFGSGITLVDTPGVGSIHQHNTQTSNEYIEKSDAVLFLLSVDSPVSEVERSFLLKTRKHAAKFYFAVNKTDTVSEENLGEFLSYCKAVLSEATGFDVMLYTISAKTGEGISSLVEKLVDDLRGSYDKLLEASVSIKLDTILAQAKTKLDIYLKGAAIPKSELETKMTLIRERQSKLTALSNEVQIFTKQQTERLVENIRARLDAKIVELQPHIYEDDQRLYEGLKMLPSRQFEPKLLAGLESIMLDILTALDTEGLTMLDVGYAGIVKELGDKAEDTARFLSGMLKDQFGLDYPISVKEFSVSKRSDFFIRVGKSRGFSLDINSFTHLLPRDMANRRINDRAVRQVLCDLDRNKNNMVYNYSYKMQESLRTLCTEFATDISQMNGELSELLTHVEQSHKIKSEVLCQTKEKFELLICELDELRETR